MFFSCKRKLRMQTRQITNNARILYNNSLVVLHSMKRPPRISARHLLSTPLIKHPTKKSKIIISTQDAYSDNYGKFAFAVTFDLTKKKEEQKKKKENNT